MQETLYALDFPPGLVNNGTTYQTKGRWHAGNGVRFFQGTIQPVGGWSVHTVIGTLSGTPNAMLAWESVDALQWIAVGTSHALYVISSLTGQAYSITPTILTDQVEPFQWDLTTFGTFLIAVLRTSNQLGGAISGKTTVYRWEGNLAVPAVVNTTDAGGPQSSYGAVATPERFLVLLRGADPGDYTRDPAWVG